MIIQKTKFIHPSDPHYATRMMRVVKKAANKPPIDPQLEVREGELWHSKHSARRGIVISANQMQVTITFDENCLLARRTHSISDFLRLYTKC